MPNSISLCRLPITRGPFRLVIAILRRPSVSTEYSRMFILSRIVLGALEVPLQGKAMTEIPVHPMRNLFLTVVQRGALHREVIYTSLLEMGLWTVRARHPKERRTTFPTRTHPHTPGYPQYIPTRTQRRSKHDMATKPSLGRASEPGRGRAVGVPTPSCSVPC